MSAADNRGEAVSDETLTRYALCKQVPFCVALCRPCRILMIICCTFVESRMISW